MSLGRILIVDDDPLVLESTALALQREGYEVETTSDVFALPLRVGRFRPDAILLDMELPAMKGDRLAKTLRHLRVMIGALVIFYSGASGEALHDAVRATGAAGYIPKGVGRQELLRRLRGFLES